MNILDDYRHDRQLAGSLPHMRSGETQRRWDVFLSAVYGLPIDDAGLAIFREHTGRSTRRPGGYSEAVIITGRQSGKSQTAADIVAFEAMTAALEGSGDGLYALLIAQDQRGAIRTLFKYVSAPFERVPMMASLQRTATADTIVLDNGVTVAAYPCRPAAVRGLRGRVAVVDELAFFRSSENIPTDTEMLRALRPCLATTGGRLIVLSSPYGQTGALWELHRAHYGRDDSPTLVWVAPAPAMNPTLPADYLARMEQDDPEAYRSEVLGEFRSGIATFLDPLALDDCVGDYRERGPVAGVHYHAFADPSGGRGDATTVAVAHAEGPERVVVDAVRAWHGDTDSAAAGAGAFLKSYGLHGVMGDNYGADLTVKSFQRVGIAYVPRPPGYDKGRFYLELLPLVLARRVVLPTDAALLRELRGLERRRGFAGRDRVDHRPGAHDDRANAVAGAAYLAAQATSVVCMPIGVEQRSYWRDGASWQ